MPNGPAVDPLNTTPFWWGDKHNRPAVVPRMPTVQFDVVVVGAGYTGLSAALHLARAGRSVIVLDSGKAGHGASTRNAGICTDQLKPGLGALTKTFGRDIAIALIKEAQQSLDFLRNFVIAEGIECSIEPSGRFRGALMPAHLEVMMREYEAVDRAIGLEYEVVPKDRVQSEIGTGLYVGGIVLPRLFTLDPAAYHAGLLQRAIQAGAILMEMTSLVSHVRDRSGFTLTTARGTIRARDMMVATNGYTGSATPYLRRRVIPVLSCMIATEEMAPERVARLMPKRRSVVDSNRLLVYYRTSPDGRRILFGGRPNYYRISERRAADRLHGYLRIVFPELADVAVTHSWMGNIAYSFDKLPHTGVHDGYHYALGCCGAGVAMSTWLGRKMALRMMGVAEGASAFADIGHPTVPFYDGTPWFLPAVQLAYRVGDLVGR